MTTIPLADAFWVYAGLLAICLIIIAPHRRRRKPTTNHPYNRPLKRL